MYSFSYYLGYHCIPIALLVWAFFKKKDPWSLIIIAAAIEIFAVIYGHKSAGGQGFPFAELLAGIVLVALGAGALYLKQRLGR